ncbi:ribosome maturation factor RimP [Asticcacaulis sp. BYS171W]|uniref:Ribosome maturation factor RimP n=1 Tax=Asticcacaulis aquaticus TaxID=2984212 RepID=A0ABT5HSN7_9CAUL|nr:ribosome maturation factor RimP [Asticcacaulis aquaticus]MDC7683083.1 ribosome maturation factor RimP [Asticcacaulis aquaticus]
MATAAALQKASRFFVAQSEEPKEHLLRAKTTEDRKLIEAFDPIAETLGLDIVRVRLMGSNKPGGARRLQIMAERKTDGEISVNQCARLSRAVSGYLEETDPISGEYILEVSSPGIDRPLTRLKDFDTYQGLVARLELDRLAEGRKRFRGTLAGTEDGEYIAIDLEDEEDTAMIPFAWIVDAKLVLNDELMKLGAEKAAARRDQEEDEDDEDFEDDVDFGDEEDDDFEDADNDDFDDADFDDESDDNKPN